MSGTAHLSFSSLSTQDLLVFCSSDTNDSQVWNEFLRRFGPAIRMFIRRTLRQFRWEVPAALRESSTSGFQPGLEDDLFQTCLLKLVEKDCAVLRRFSGDNPEAFLAYLAVITRSIVRDHRRRQRARKRPVLVAASEPKRQLDGDEESDETEIHEGRLIPEMEREILAEELKGISIKVIENMSGGFSARDRLIFELYYFHDVPCSQIAECQGVELSKAGVEAVLNRVRDRVREMTAM